MRITIRDARNFIEGNLYSILGNKLRPWYVTEQALFRAFKCYPCLKAGKCLRCGCSTPQMFFAKAKIDPDGKWGIMMGKYEWEEYRKTADYLDTIRQINKYVDLAKYGYDKEMLKRIPRAEDDNKREKLKDFMDSFVPGPSKEPLLQSSRKRKDRKDSRGSLSTNKGGERDSDKVVGEASESSSNSGGEDVNGMEKEVGGEG